MGKIDLPAKVESPAVKPVQSKPEPIVNIDTDKATAKAVSEVISQDVPDDSLEMLSVKRALGIDSLNQDYDRHVRGILEWGKSKGMDRHEMFSEIRKIEYKLGLTDSTEDRVRRIHTYIKLDQSVKSMVNRMEALKYYGR